MTRAALLLVLVPSPVLAQQVTFDRDVKPVLKKHCLTCHHAERPRGELDLSTFAGVQQGGASGKAVVAGKPADSPLYTLAAHLDDPKMPPNAPKMPQRELDVIAKWIEGGLVERPAAAAPAAKPAGGLGPVTPLARPAAVTALAVSPTAPLAAVAGLKQVIVFDLKARAAVGALPFPEGQVNALTFSRDGKLLVAAGGVGGASGIAVGFRVGTWDRAFAVGDEPDAILAADLSPDGKFVLIGGPTRVAKVIAAADGKVVYTIRKPTDWVTAVAFSPDGLLAAAGDRFGGLVVWEAATGKEFAVLRGHTKGVTGLGWRAGGDELVSAADDGTVRVWNLHTATESAKFDAHAGGVLAMAVRPDGRLVTGGRDKAVKAWPEGKSVGATADEVQRVAVTADGAVLAGDWAGELKLWPHDGAAVALTRPTAPPVRTVAVVRPVLPTLPAAKPAAPPAVANSDDLARKRAALKAVEDAAERLKDEAARSPQNAALAKAYLQLCEAALAMKADVIAAESAAPKAK